MKSRETYEVEFKAERPSRPCPLCLLNELSLWAKKDRLGQKHYHVACDNVFGCSYDVRGFSATTESVAIRHWDKNWEDTQLTRKKNCRREYFRSKRKAKLITN